jgi:hypothetical protein
LCAPRRANQGPIVRRSSHAIGAARAARSGTPTEEPRPVALPALPPGVVPWGETRLGSATSRNQSWCCRRRGKSFSDRIALRRLLPPLLPLLLVRAPQRRWPRVVRVATRKLRSTAARSDCTPVSTAAAVTSGNTFTITTRAWRSEAPIGSSEARRLPRIRRAEGRSLLTTASRRSEAGAPPDVSGDACICVTRAEVRVRRVPCVSGRRISALAKCVPHGCPACVQESGQLSRSGAVRSFNPRPEGVVMVCRSDPFVEYLDHRVPRLDDTDQAFQVMECQNPEGLNSRLP